jgi:hypothetical protein
MSNDGNLLKWSPTPAFGGGLHHYDDSDKKMRGTKIYHRTENSRRIPENFSFEAVTPISRLFCTSNSTYIIYIGNSAKKMGQEAHLRSKSSFFRISMLLLGTKVYSKLLTMHYDLKIGAIRIKVTESTWTFKIRKSRYELLYSVPSNSAKGLCLRFRSCK